MKASIYTINPQAIGFVAKIFTEINTDNRE
jgi:hypothetical protein